MFSEYGEILGYFTSAKKAYDYLTSDGLFWYDKCHYSYFQRTISKESNNAYWSLRNENYYKFKRRFVPCFEVGKK